MRVFAVGWVLVVVRTGLAPDYMVVGEPTGSKMMRLQKGMLKVRLSCKGVACHSGYPQLGVSAIDPLVEVLHAINHRTWPSSPELGETTVNIGLMEGGQAANALAEASEAVVMFRLIGDPADVLSVVEGIAAEHDCAVEVRRERNAGVLVLACSSVLLFALVLVLVVLFLLLCCECRYRGEMVVF